MRYRLTITPTEETRQNATDYDVSLESIVAEFTITGAYPSAEDIAKGTMEDLRLTHTCDYKIEQM